MSRCSFGFISTVRFLYVCMVQGESVPWLGSRIQWLINDLGQFIRRHEKSEMVIEFCSRGGKAKTMSSDCKRNEAEVMPRGNFPILAILFPNLPIYTHSFVWASTRIDWLFLSRIDLFR